MEQKGAVSKKHSAWLMKKNLVNICIGVLLIILGCGLYHMGSKFWSYTGVFCITYGFFVVLFKLLKLICSADLENEQLNTYEQVHRLIIPDYIRSILEFQLNTNKKVEFEIPSFGTFHILDYNQKGNDLTNPYFIAEEIEAHMVRCLFPAVPSAKIIPFAGTDDYMFLFVEEQNDDIILIDLDAPNCRPLILKGTIECYLDIDGLQLRNGKYYYNGLKNRGPDE